MRASSGGQRSRSRTDKIRLLVADDHVTVLEGLVAIIGRQPDMHVLAAASNGREAVDSGETFFPPSLVTKLTAGLSAESLTDRELEVLALLARGKSNKEIGTMLYISESTVKSHLRNIFTKLNVLSRTEAIAAASRQELVKV